ncbi:M48 family metalloprotease [Dethiosulfatarculus sandiegensis]|uniref:Peptidase M48 n=1 Tax=Dethiosulfatarculus sandiegensis TaxID=1429043 RepID=A0A0D2J180_9BACT|nr:M48 family metalloprotease [Dethiosulfatarculus sandiegensis]KIX11964.1 peptidase M48 [Dethiosulfatarculus sandiegensis]
MKKNLSRKKMIVKSLACLASCVFLAAAAGFLPKADVPRKVVCLDLFDSIKSGLENANKILGTAEKVADSTQKATQDLTPRQEYFLGRGVAAVILKKYPSWDNNLANAYLNLLGQSLAGCSQMPQTYGGYHFQILNSNEINAFAAPGGLIMVTRGMLRICRSEAELAAVLAHEIGHVQNRHGLSAIKQNRMLELGGLLLKEGTQEFGNSELKKLTGLFGESVGDVTKTLLVSGYSRDQELEADQAAVRILTSTGYPPQALTSMLRKMKTALADQSTGFAKTHPDPLDRVESVQDLLQTDDEPAAPQARINRFALASRGF